MSSLWHRLSGRAPGTGDPRPAPSAAPPTEQRREHFRVSIAGTVVFRLDGASVSLRLIEMSETGVRCGGPLPRRVFEGERLVIAVDVLHEPLLVAVQVVRSGTGTLGNELALRFLDLAEENRVALRLRLYEEQRRILAARAGRAD